MRFAIILLIDLLIALAVWFAGAVGILILLRAIGGADWAGHFGHNHWVTYVCILPSAGIAGLAFVWVDRRWLSRYYRPK